MLCLQGYNFTIHYCPGKEIVIPDTLSIQSQDRSWLAIGYHHPSCLHNARPQRSFPASLCQWSRKIELLPTSSLLAGPRTSRRYPHPPSILATQRDPHHWGWSSPARWSNRDSSCQKGESPTSTASIPSGNNKITVACTWKFLLAQHQQGHQRSSLPVLSLHPVLEPECCSTPHTYTYAIAPMGDVYHRHLHTKRNWPPGSGWLLLEDDLSLMPSTWPEQCQQGHLTDEGDVFRAWHPQSPSLWQWPTICEYPVCQLLYILGHNTWNLKSTLPTIQWICWGMHQVHQTCTPTSQVQQCWSTSCLTSTPSYTYQHQAPISSRAVVPMPTQNNHSGQDTQQQPISPTSLWADWHMLWIC